MTKHKLLLLLKRNDGKLLSGGYAAKELGVSRNAVWKAVCSLKEEGFWIDTVPNKGYLYRGHDDRVLSAEELYSLLHTKNLGGNIVVCPTVDSTSLEARRLAEAGAPNGMTVLADCQTDGRGRRDHSFYSPAGAGIYMSVIIRPKESISVLSTFPIRASLAVTRAIDSLCGLNVQIKWPNDLYWNGKKLCGILTNYSASAEDGMLEYVVIGIGINVGRAVYPETIPAVSLEEAAGEAPSRHALIALVLEELERSWEKGTLDLLCSEEIQSYEERMSCYGDFVTLEYLSGEREEGRVLGITPEGFLHLQAGEREKVLKNGEVSLRLD